MASYVGYTDLITFADERTVKDLLSDDGNYVGDASNDPKLLTILSTASGMVEAACGVSDLYTPDDLAKLSGNSLSLLKSLVCSLAIFLLISRRPEKYGTECRQAIREETEEYLDKLRKGMRLFDDQSRRTAGVPNVDGPTAVDYQNLNSLPVRARNFFPSMAQRLPLGRA